MFRTNLRVKFVSRVVVFTNIEEGLETNLARKFLRILVFLVRKGLDESDKQSFKFLVIKEVFSSSIGAVVVSDEKVGEQQLISKWFGEFGLRNSAEEVSVVLLTDSESTVSSMVANVQGYQFLVQKAPPQAHESVGHAERAIRGVKEAVKVQLLEFERLGYTLQFEKKGNPSLC